MRIGVNFYFNFNFVVFQNFCTCEKFISTVQSNFVQNVCDLKCLIELSLYTHSFTDKIIYKIIAPLVFF